MTSLGEVHPERLLAAALQAEKDFVMVATILERLTPDDPRYDKVAADAETLKFVLDQFVGEIDRRNDLARQVDAIFEG